MIAGVHTRVDTVVEEIADIKTTMATKDDLAAFKGEVVELISGEFAKFRTEDIEGRDDDPPRKRDAC